MSENILVIIGQHRSGSSVLSGSLLNMGGYLGVNYKHEEDQYNEKGYFESSWTDTVNNAILNMIGCHWHHVIDLPDEWYLSNRLNSLYDRVKNNIKKDLEHKPKGKFYMLKDPRISILLPFYLKVFKELNLSPKFIFSDRENKEMSDSLVKRDSLDPKNLDILFNYHRFYVKKYIGDYPIIWSNTFSNISYKPINYFKYIKNYLKLPLIIDENTSSYLDDFVDMKLKHNHTKKSVKVISTYFGTRRTNIVYHKESSVSGKIPKTSGINSTVEFIKDLVNNERSIDSGVFMDTLLVNHDMSLVLDTTEIKEFLDTIDGTPTRNGVIKVINRPWENGVGGSFGSFNYAYQKHKNDYYYWFFTEDNVIQTSNGYFKQCIEQLNGDDGIGYICAYRYTTVNNNPHHKSHCHGGCGATTIKKLNRVNDRFGSLVYYKEPYTKEMLTKIGTDEFSKYSSSWYRNFEEIGEVGFTNSFLEVGFKLVDINKSDRFCCYYNDCY